MQPHYDDYLSREAVKNQNERGYKTFHPSAFGGCLRKIALQYYGEIDPKYKEPVKFDPKSQRIFRAGHAHHFRMQEELSEMGILRGCWKSKITGKIYGRDSKTGIFMPQSLEEVGEEKHPDDKRELKEIFEYVEIKVENKEYNFSGHCDGIIQLDPDNPDTMYIVDFKTMKFERFEILARSGNIDNNYLTQINIYMWILGVRKGLIFYEDKNTHQIKEYEVFYDENLIEDIKRQAKTLLSFFEKKQLPKMPDQYEKNKKPCMYCGYKDVLCWKK